MPTDKAAIHSEDVFTHDMRSIHSGRAKQQMPPGRVQVYMVSPAARKRRQSTAPPQSVNHAETDNARTHRTATPDCATAMFALASLCARGSKLVTLAIAARTHGLHLHSVHRVGGACLRCIIERAQRHRAPTACVGERSHDTMWKCLADVGAIIEAMEIMRRGGWMSKNLELMAPCGTPAAIHTQGNCSHNATH